MDISADEFMDLYKRLSDKDVRISELERQVAVLEEELRVSRAERDSLQLECDRLARVSMESEIEAIYLKSYIMLSAERIRSFVTRLCNVERWAFLRTFVTCTVPKELEAAERQIIEDALALPEDGVSGVSYNNYYQAGSQNQVFNGGASGRFDSGK